jgi:hypothetical protein
MLLDQPSGFAIRQSSAGLYVDNLLPATRTARRVNRKSAAGVSIENPPPECKSKNPPPECKSRDAGA